MTKFLSVYDAKTERRVAVNIEAIASVHPHEKGAEIRLLNGNCILAAEKGSEITDALHRHGGVVYPTPEVEYRPRDI